MNESYLKLLERYNVSIPRYTSYPTALELKPLADLQQANDTYRRALNNDIASPKVSIYVHLPHCPKLCYFCACNKIISLDPNSRRDYLLLLEREIATITESMPEGSQVVQVHLGGGSPSYLEAGELVALNSMLASFPLVQDCEKSVEVDPRTFSSEKFHELYKFGYRRYSLGVQDFNKEVQQLVNRVQPLALVQELVNQIRSREDTSINFDLIYGLPGQTQAGFEETIEKVIEFQPERIALYGFAQVAWKAKAQNTLKKHNTPSAAERLQFFISAQSELERAGYVYIGLDHFALPHDELAIALKERRLRRNFMGYTTVKGDFLLGCGSSAISDLNSHLVQNAVDLTQYQKMIDSMLLPIVKSLSRSPEDSLRSTIIEKLMCNRSLNINELTTNQEWESIYVPIFKEGIKVLKPLVDDGLVETSEDRILVTELGSYFLRNIASAFDAYLNLTSNKEKRFSSAV